MKCYALHELLSDFFGIEFCQKYERDRLFPRDILHKNLVWGRVIEDLMSQAQYRPGRIGVEKHHLLRPFDPLRNAF